MIKAMVFLVDIYGCESWTIRKAEHQKIDASKLWFWRRLLRFPWTARRSNQSILKEINLNIHWKDRCWSWSRSWSSHLMWRADSLEKTVMLGKIEGKRRRGWHEMAGCHHRLDGHEFVQTLADSEGQKSLVCCSAQSLRVRHDLLT